MIGEPKRYRLMLLVLTLVPLAACAKKDGGNKNGNNQTNGNAQMAANLGVDFANVKGFIIGPTLAPTPAALADGSASVAKQVLYALNTDGTLAVTTVIAPPDDDAASKPTTTTQTSVPQGIFDTAKFTFFRYGSVFYEDSFCYFVAARKTDSALFCVGVFSRADADSSPLLPNILTDVTGNLVYFLGSRDTGSGVGIVRLDFTDPAQPVQSVIVDDATDGSVSTWAINDKGDVAAYVLPVGQVTPSVNAILRIYKIGGGYVDVGTGSLACLTSGVGAAQSDFYYVKSGSDNYGTLYRLTEASGFAIPGNKIFADDHGTAGLFDCTSYMRTVDSIYATTIRGNVVGFVELVPAGTNDPKSLDVDLFKGGKLDIGKAFPTGIVLKGSIATGSSGLARYDFTRFTTILTPGDYDVSTFSVSSSGETTFGGRRAADGARVIGTVPAPPAAPTVAVVTQTLAGDVTEILRIK